jgi:hypothetical protein
MLSFLHQQTFLSYGLLIYDEFNKDLWMGVWVVEHISSKEFLGIIGLFSSSSKLLFSPCVEILWRILTPPVLQPLFNCC